jgi:hypothetical protein
MASVTRAASRRMTPSAGLVAGSRWRSPAPSGPTATPASTQASGSDTQSCSLTTPEVAPSATSKPNVHNTRSQRSKAAMRWSYGRCQPLPSHCLRRDVSIAAALDSNGTITIRPPNAPLSADQSCRISRNLATLELPGSSGYARLPLRRFSCPAGRRPKPAADFQVAAAGLRADRLPCRPRWHSLAGRCRPSKRRARLRLRR